MCLCRGGIRVVPHCLVYLAQLERLVPALGNFADNTRRSASNDAEARNDCVRRKNGTVKYADVVLDDGEFANDYVVPDMNVAADRRRLDHSTLADEDMVAHSERHVGKGTAVALWGQRMSMILRNPEPSIPFVRTTRRTQAATSAKEAVTSRDDRGGV